MPWPFTMESLLISLFHLYCTGRYSHSKREGGREGVGGRERGTCMIIIDSNSLVLWYFKLEGVTLGFT